MAALARVHVVHKVDVHVVILGQATKVSKVDVLKKKKKKDMHDAQLSHQLIWGGGCPNTFVQSCPKYLSADSG